MIAISSDHGGYQLKEAIKKHLSARGDEFKDFGTHSEEPCDYPVYAKMTAKAVASGECELGIVVCGTGIGVSIAANRVRGVRAALCTDARMAEVTRLHNDSNVLALGGRVLSEEEAFLVVDKFLDTKFSGEERHIRRIKMLEED